MSGKSRDNRKNNRMERHFTQPGRGRPSIGKKLIMGPDGLPVEQRVRISGEEAIKLFLQSHQIHGQPSRVLMFTMVAKSGVAPAPEDEAGTDFDLRVTVLGSDLKTADLPLDEIAAFVRQISAQLDAEAENRKKASDPEG